MNEEEFKCIPDFPWYRIGTHGTIISDLRGKPKVLKQATDRYGYKKVTLFNNTKRHYFTIHRLVALTFLENPNNLPQVNHKDGNKTNNHIDNLEWCDQPHNMQHAVKMGLSSPPSGENHYKTTISNETVKEIRNKFKEGATNMDIRKEYNLGRSIVSRIKLNQSFKDI